MLYNLHVVKYNGFTQLRVYRKAIHKNDDNFEIKEKKLNAIEKIFACPDTFYDVSESEYDDIVKESIHLNNLAEQRDFNSERSRIVSLNRTKQMIYEYALNNQWEYFVTLTFDSEKIKHDRTDYKKCIHTLKCWLNHIKARKCPELMYLAIPELHKDGAVHFHLLMAQCGELEFVDSHHRIKGQRIYNLKNWRYGFSSASKVLDSVRCANYITKYISKDLCIHEKYMSRYYKSNNLKTCVHEYYNLPYDIIDDIISKSDIEYLKTQNIDIAEQKIQYITISNDIEMERYEYGRIEKTD